MKPGTCPVAEILCTLLKLVPAYLNYQSRGDLTSPEQLRDGDQYDFIIVGAGPAGCVLTNRLSEVEDWKVLLLEAGGEEPELIQVPAFTPYTWGTRLNWNYTTQPDERVCGGTPCMWASGRGLGGGTLHNPMMYNRGNRHNFDEWESMGNVGWSYKGVLPYFKKFENNLDPSLMKDTKYHGVGGPQSVGSFPYKDKNVEAFLDVFKEMGYKEVDVNGKTQTGFTMVQLFQQNGARLSANRAFLSATRKKRRNLKIITNVRVTKIIIDEEKENGNGVEYILENNRDIKGRIYAKKEVIISCGAISSAQLLMLSGIGPKDTLKSLGIPVIQDLKVGFNLQNHVYASDISLVLNSKRSTIPPTDGDVLGDILKYAVGQRGPLSAEGIYGINAYTNSRFSNTDIDFPDIAVSLFPEVKFDNVTLAGNFWIPFAYYNRITVGVANTKPKSRGIVSINTTDPFSYPLIYPYYFYDNKDYEVLLDGYISMAKQFLNSKALKYLDISIDKTPLPKCRRFKFGSNKYWKCVVLKYRNFPHHYAGTCKMGPSDDVTAVVDPQLRVHNVKNLRVIDASIMPALVNANTNAVVLMIAEKGADMIKETWLSKT